MVSPTVRTGRRALDGWSVAALCYLAAPALVFVGGWLRAPFNGAAAIGLIFIVARAAGGLLRRNGEPACPGAVAWLALLALVWTAFSGAGHLFYANLDWRTRDAVYADLILSAWPPAYATDGAVPVVLRSALGYYLPPALLASWAGLGWAPAVLQLWTALGVFLFLALLPLPRAPGLRLIAASLCVVFFSGMDYAGTILVNGQTPVFPLALEWWSEWTYTSPTGQLLWAPNHAVALWLGTALYFRHRDDPSLPTLGLVCAPLLLLWTPFAILGLLPYFALTVWRQPREAWSVLRAEPAALWLIVALLAWLIARYFSLAAPVGDIAVTATSLASDNAGCGDMVETLRAYAAFVLCEFLLLALTLWRGIPDALRDELKLALGVLLLLPLLRFGPSNDLLLRASTPSLLLLLLALLLVLRDGAQRLLGTARAIALAAILAVGAVTPMFEILRVMQWPQTPPNYGENLLRQQGGRYSPHYFGRLDAPELGRLFRPPQPVASGSARTGPAAGPR